MLSLKYESAIQNYANRNNKNEPATTAANNRASAKVNEIQGCEAYNNGDERERGSGQIHNIGESGCFTGQELQGWAH